MRLAFYQRSKVHISVRRIASRTWKNLPSTSSLYPVPAASPPTFPRNRVKKKKYAKQLGCRSRDRLEHVP